MPIPPRIHIFLARESPQALILRRGPSKWSCTIGWNRADDTFELGQWVKARIRPGNCALSPDGRHFAYHAFRGDLRDGMDGWTAISRTPYLKAIGFWPSSYGTWVSPTPVFVSNDEFFVDPDQAPRFLPEHPRWLGAKGSPLRQERSGGPWIRFDVRNVGWTEKQGPLRYEHFCRVPSERRKGWRFSFALHHVRTAWHEKELPDDWVLRRWESSLIDEPKGGFPYRYRLLSGNDEPSPDTSDWTWADHDGERLIWVANGVLYASTVGPQGITDAKELYDLNPLTPTPRPAPY